MIRIQATVARSADRAGLFSLLALLLVANLADMVSTYVGMRHLSDIGGYEGNPLVAAGQAIGGLSGLVLVMGFIAAGQLGALIWTWRSAQRRGERAAVVLAASVVAVFHGVLAWHNISLLAYH